MNKQMNHAIWPKISVITPSYNQGDFLEATICSVLNQEYPNLEYIIVDGDSTDASLDIIKRYSDSLAYWVSEPDRGQSHALNKGFAKASGDILCWINSDDCLADGALHFVGSHFKENPDISWLVGRCLIINEDGNTVGEFERNWQGFEHLLQFWKGAMLPQPSSFWRREMITDRKLCEDLHYSMDYDLWVSFAESSEPVLVEMVLAKYRMQPNAKTVKQADMFLLDMLKSLRPYWQKRGMIFRFACELAWRKNTSQSFQRTAFKRKQEGNPQEARRLLKKSISTFSPAIFSRGVLSLALRLIVGDNCVNYFLRLFHGRRSDSG